MKGHEASIYHQRRVRLKVPRNTSVCVVAIYEEKFEPHPVQAHFYVIQVLQFM